MVVCIGRKSHQTGFLVPASDPIPVTLALQGGGSLGAFTWGVLDRLLDRPELRIEAISGASAGAMNAAMLAQGLATGGSSEAKRLLETFWCRVAITPGCPDTAAAQLLVPLGIIMAPVVEAMRHSARGLSQDQLNPLGLNPLREVLDDLLDPSAFGKEGAPLLVIATTRVRTGEARLFRGAEVTAGVLLASACLPQLFPAVEIDGEPYWDGGYASNPPLRALIEAGAPADLLVVRTMPVERLDLPTSAAGLLERTNELAFGAALRHELESLAFAQRLLADRPQAAPGVLARLREARLHMLGAEEAFRALKGRQPPGSHHGLPARDAGAWPRRCRPVAGSEPRFHRGPLDGEPVGLRSLTHEPPGEANVVALARLFGMSGEIVGTWRCTTPHGETVAGVFREATGRHVHADESRAVRRGYLFNFRPHGIFYPGAACRSAGRPTPERQVQRFQSRPSRRSSLSAHSIIYGHYLRTLPATA